jgi:hypothetical protein
MVKMKDIRLHLNIEGATWEEIERGISAAEAVFAREGVTAVDAAAGAQALDMDAIGLPRHRALQAAVWHKADEAAREACCAEWRLQISGH